MRHTRYRIGIVVLLVCGLLAGCGGSGSGTRTVDARGFTGVSATAGIDVIVSTSATWSAELSADPQVIDRIVVEVRGATLWIGLKAGTFARGRYLANKAQVSIGMPALARLDVTDGSRALVAVKQPGGDLSVVLSRGSQVSGSVACAALTISASGSSVAELSGTADRISLVASDRAKLKLNALETPSLDAALSGGSTAAVAVSQRLTVEAAGGSGLSFRGDARVESQTLNSDSWLKKE
jgi:hypothetical protein